MVHSTFMNQITEQDEDDSDRNQDGRGDITSHRIADSEELYVEYYADFDEEQQETDARGKEPREVYVEFEFEMWGVLCAAGRFHVRKNTRGHHQGQQVHGDLQRIRFFRKIDRNYIFRV